MHQLGVLRRSSSQKPGLCTAHKRSSVPRKRWRSNRPPPVLNIYIHILPRTDPFTFHFVSIFLSVENAALFDRRDIVRYLDIFLVFGIKDERRLGENKMIRSKDED